ncbi:hypothetical protein VTG60DRAFT_4365 [Thermothelomyces hinnuleus]
MSAATPPTPTPNPPGPVNDNTEIKEEEEKMEEEETPPTTPLARLRYLYRDVTRLRAIASPAIVLHPADRARRPPLVGIAAAQQHEEALVAAAADGGGGLVMEVESAAVDSRGVFGCVMGTLRAGGGDSSSSSSSSSSPGLTAADGCRTGEDAGGACSGEGTLEGGDEQGGKQGDDRDGRRRGTIEMPFCGVWRFDEMGRAIEH